MEAVSTRDRTGRCARGNNEAPASEIASAPGQSKEVDKAMVTRKPQASNTSDVTRLKSERLEVVTITEREAYVTGDHDTYVITFRSLSCSCPAGLCRLHCSHVQAAVREWARMHGFATTTFYANEQAAERAAGRRRSEGKRVEVHVQHGWYFVTVGTPVAAAARPRRSFEAVQRDADALFS